MSELHDELADTVAPWTGPGRTSGELANALLPIIERRIAQAPPERLVLVGEWAAAQSDGCTCSDPGPEWGHEPHCGLEPFAKIDTTEHDAQVRAETAEQIAAAIDRLDAPAHYEKHRHLAWSEGVGQATRIARQHTEEVGSDDE